MRVWQLHTSVARGDAILEGVLGISLLFDVTVTFSNPHNQPGAATEGKGIPGRPQWPRSRGHAHPHTKQEEMKQKQKEKKKKNIA